MGNNLRINLNVNGDENIRRKIYPGKVNLETI